MLYTDVIELLTDNELIARCAARRKTQFTSMLLSDANVKILLITSDHTLQ